MSESKNAAIQYLRDIGILNADCTKLEITFKDGSVIDLVEKFAEFGKQQSSAAYQYVESHRERFQDE